MHVIWSLQAAAHSLLANTALENLVVTLMVAMIAGAKMANHHALRKLVIQGLKAFLIASGGKERCYLQ